MYINEFNIEKRHFKNTFITFRTTRSNHDHQPPQNLTEPEKDKEAYQLRKPSETIAHAPSISGRKSLTGNGSRRRLRSRDLRSHSDGLIATNAPEGTSRLLASRANCPHVICCQTRPICNPLAAVAEAERFPEEAAL